VLNPTYGYVNECQLFLDTWDPVASGIGASIVVADDVQNKTDVLFYVGAGQRSNLAPTRICGCRPDHLTSYAATFPPPAR